MYSKKSARHQKPQRNWLRPVLIGVFILLAIGTAYFAYTGTRAFFQNWVITDLGEGFSFVNPTATNGSNVSETTPGIGEPTIVPDQVQSPGIWEGADPITVLVMGLDYRDWESGEGPPRTDTMILLTLDPLAKTAGMLSIPRDLYVPIPGFTYERINVAYRFGELYEIPGGGPALATRTVEQLLGIPIDFYAQVDFSAFVRIIDEIGGLKVDIKEKIVVDPIGKENNKKTLKPGITVLPGELALAYARARNTEGGDFDRASRQQDVILAIRKRILEFDLIPILLTKAPVLYQELSKGIQTNMTLEQALQIGWLAKDIKDENVKRGIIGSGQVVFVLTPSGDQVLKPLPDKIRILRDEVFGTANLASPLATLAPTERVKEENANVTLYNGTLVDQLSRRTADFLSSKGFNIPETNLGNASEPYPYTTIIDYTGNPYTVKMLVDELSVSYTRVFLRYNPNSSVDVEVNLGNDWVNSGKLP